MKIFKTAISWTLAAGSFHYCVMSRCFLLVTKVFNLHVCRWQHYEMTPDRLFNDVSLESFIVFNFLCGHIIYIFELGLYDLYLPLTL